MPYSQPLSIVHRDSLACQPFLAVTWLTMVCTQIFVNQNFSVNQHDDCHCPGIFPADLLCCCPHRPPSLQRHPIFIIFFPPPPPSPPPPASGQRRRPVIVVVNVDAPALVGAWARHPHWPCAAGGVLLR
jgi:hypothetical protein